MAAARAMVTDLSWGSHLCLLYRTAADLLTFQVPFFKAAISANQAGMWFINDPITTAEAEAALRDEVSDFRGCCAGGQIELLHGGHQYLGTSTKPHEMACFWADREAACKQAGYVGLRMSGNVPRVESPKVWEHLMEYERLTDAYLHERKMVSLCCYQEESLGAPELADIISAHQGCLLRRGGGWEIVPNHEYRRAEAQTERFFSIGQEMMGIAAMAHGGWLAANAMMQRVLGYRDEELPPLPLLPLVQPESYGSSLEAAVRMFRGENLSGFQQHLRCKNGSLRWISWNIYCDLDEKLIYCSGRDITPDKAAEAAVRKQLDDSERVSRLKDEFLAVVSHELRTPLNAILGWAQVLTRRTPTEAQTQDGLGAIMRNARAQADLIEDLLDMSRMVSGRLRLEMTWVSLEDIISVVTAAAGPGALAKRLVMRTEIDPDVPLVWADPARLQQILSNLVTNAIKFTPEGGEIRIRARRAGPGVAISVADTGEGIPPQFIPYVFERFSQRDASTTRKHKGLGLGLSIVKRLAELHGGSVRAASEGEGRGAEFTVTLPLPENSRHEEAGRRGARRESLAEPVAAGSVAGVSVLVVDDEADSIQVTSSMLQAHSALVFRATNADEAVELVRTKRPAVILADICMPREDGYMLLRRIRSLPASEGRDTPAVAVTALARDTDRQRSLEAGFAGHLSKPLNEAALIAAVAAHARGT